MNSTKCVNKVKEMAVQAELEAIKVAKYETSLDYANFKVGVLNAKINALMCELMEDLTDKILQSIGTKTTTEGIPQKELSTSGNNTAGKQV